MSVDLGPVVVAVMRSFARVLKREAPTVNVRVRENSEPRPFDLPSFTLNEENVFEHGIVVHKGKETSR